MILEKLILISFIVALCAFCDDGASTSQGTTMSVLESNYDSGSTKSLVSYDPESAKDFTSFANDDSEFTSLVNYEFTTVSESITEFLTTNSQPMDTDGSSSPSTIDEKPTTIVSDDVTSTDNSTICNPMWSENASGKGIFRNY